MNILFDYWGAQEQAQLGLQPNDPSRLGPLYDQITAAGWTYNTGPETVDSSSLDGVDVFVLTSRWAQPWMLSELKALSAFVLNGGGVWNMANHAPFNAFPPPGDLDNYVRYPSAIASTFFTSFEAAAYQIPNPQHLPTGIPVNLTGSNLGDHPIINGQSGWPIATNSSSVVVSEVVTRSFCGIYPNDFGSTVCGLSGLSTVLNLQNNSAITDGVLWAMAVEGQNVTGSGRVLVMGDSGWLASVNSGSPGPGEYENGDNEQFSLNCLAWLGNY